ncbi:carbohydrate ABC transporter permease [Angustibacter aerolatus]
MAVLERAIDPAGRSRRVRVAPRRRTALPLALLAPSVAVLLVLTGWPLVKLLVTSTQHYGRAQVFGAPPEFVGLENYRAVLGDTAFWQVLLRSALFCAACVVLTMTLGTLIALMMGRLSKGMRLAVSVGLLLAWAMPALTSIVIWGWMFDSQYGVVNFLLGRLGIDAQGHSWLISPLSFFAVAALVIVWQSVPFVAFTVYAALTQVPDEVDEAAQLDGASAAQRFRHITLAYLRPVLRIVTVLQVIWDLRVFTQIFALQDAGGITSRTSTLGVYVYQVGVAQGRFDVGSAIAVVMVVIMLVASAAYVRQTLREEQP